MAQRGLNKVCLIGFVGQDPEIRYTADKQPVAVFSVATGDSWKDKETGETKERTQWHRIVVYNKLAEIAAAHLKKGTQVYLEGRLQVRKWLDALGAERQSTEVVVDINGMLQMLGKSEGDKNTGENSGNNENTDE
ncbi:single-stranded DNA-binding protein [Salmonella enterica]|nr:single-stranded DNA-binding protein [Salmonella enterica subsp. enterica]EKS4627003.1 single-stranded DNA-binding protein [Salmonella enterica]EKS4720044.1 single-stranded DNA-binding protein [Salmonella enterica]EKS4724500.1 single-stranded DNA-binding protein [Salmonella enterica]EKS4738162.1 single-stranded DNA-binding protein [Salmonella enterica]